MIWGANPLFKETPHLVPWVLRSWNFEEFLYGTALSVHLSWSLREGWERFRETLLRFGGLHFDPLGYKKQCLIGVWKVSSISINIMFCIWHVYQINVSSAIFCLVYSVMQDSMESALYEDKTLFSFALCTSILRGAKLRCVLCQLKTIQVARMK